MKTIRTNCPRDCYDGCGIVVDIRDSGRHRVLGDPDHPVSRGKLCSKCAISYNGVWQDPTQRLLQPLKRVGPRGSSQFEPIGWDEALAAVASRMNAARAEHGAASILHTHYSGTLSLIGFLFPNRLFNYLGASEVDPDSICNAAGHVAWTLQFGNSLIGFDPRTAADAACILVWGANPSHSAPHAHEHWLQEAPGKIVVVDPIRTESADAADLHLQLRPGTDAALAFSLLHCLQRDGNFDQAYIDAHTLGFEHLEADLARATPQWGEVQTGVPAADIEQAAAWYGAGPALLWCGQGLQRQATGGNIMRAVGLLPALTGNIGKPGAGFCYLNITPLLAGIDLGWLGGESIAREGGKKVSHMHLAERLETSDEFKVFFSWNTNPLASAPEQDRLRRALERDDLFTVVCDVFMTDTARYADIVLPAASFLEYDDVTFSYFHFHMGAQSKAGEPLGEALPNAEIFRRLAHAMGLDEAALYESDESLIDCMMQQMNTGFDFAELQRRGWFALDDTPLQPWAEQRFETPSGRIEIASEQAVAMGLPLTPQPWADAELPDGELRLLTPASKWRLNDSYANDAHIAERSGAAALHLNPSDAVRLGIREGNLVEASNATGKIVLTARLDDAVLPGTAVSYKGRWPSLEAHGGNVNFVHTARAADMGESTSVHSTVVNVVRC
ncbi:MAG: molybdopterin-dependent oxidoreductase [Gammaproteobacteria bacterium]